MLSQEELFAKCPYATAQRILSGKWALLILHHLSESTLRFGELKRLMPEMTQATLTKQLRTLEDFGIVKRKVYAQIPPKVEYELSNIGKELSVALDSLKAWGDKYITYYHSQEEKEAF